MTRSSDAQGHFVSVSTVTGMAIPCGKGRDEALT
jgi:hypothetical protein